MLYIYATSVDDGKLRQYQDWVSKNERRIRKLSPKGWKFVGVYFPVYGFGPHLSEIHWEIENYAAFDSATSVATKDNDFANLIEEWYGFLDARTQQARLLKRAGDSNTVVVTD